MSCPWQIDLKKWSCARCGFSTGRKWVVGRHIANPNIHGGDAKVVSYEEYITGVRSGLFPAPTFAYNTPPYRTTNRNELMHGHITLSDIMMTIADLRDKNWREKFKNMFSSCISQAEASSNQFILAGSEDGSLLFLKYYGYVCPHCFSIGITHDNGAARRIAKGVHLCPPHFANHSALSPEGKSFYMKSFRNELGILLFDLSTTIAAGRRFVLVGNTDYHDFHRFIMTDLSSMREFEGRVMDRGKIELDESGLKEYFGFYPNTINSFDVHFRNEKFAYELSLAIATN